MQKHHKDEPREHGHKNRIIIKMKNLICLPTSERLPGKYVYRREWAIFKCTLKHEQTTIINL